MSQGPAFRFVRRHLPEVSRLRFAVPLVALFLTACPPPPPPPPPKVAPPTPTVTEAPPPPLAPSRWIESRGNTLIGPQTADGTLCLVGGRRVLVGKDGTAKNETVRAPEGLVGLTEVVTSSGARKVIGYSEHAVYRLDDVLGEPKTLARTEGEIWKVGSGPGVVAVWDFDSDQPRYIDVETGQPKQLANMPQVPVNSIAFRSPKEGAAILEAVGLSITTDGGATWKPATETNKGDVLRTNEVRLQGDSVVATVGYGRNNVPVDLAAGKLGTAVEPQIARDEAALLKWIRRTERDPLGEAALSGVLLPSGEALVAASGLLARVDLKTGLPTEVVEVSQDESRPCWITRAGDTGWLGCSLPDEGGDEMYEPFGVFKISLTGKLAPERPVVKRSGDAELRTSPSGGVMMLGGCGPEGTRDELCVRQPDGKWSTVRPSVDPYERGAGPLSDGRVVYIRGLWEGEDPPEDVPTPTPRDDSSAEGEGMQSRQAWIVAMDAQGHEKTLATIALNPGSEVTTRGYFQEGEDKRIHGVVFNEEGPSVIIAAQNKQQVDLQKVQGASAVKLVGNFGVAFGEDKLLGTTDGGATWSEIAAPKKVLAMFGGFGEEGGYYGGGYVDDYLQLSDAGIKAEGYARVGWGAGEPLPEEREVSGGVLLQRPSNPPATGPERGAICTTAGAGTGAAPLSSSYQAQDFFVKGSPAKGTKRKASAAGAGRYGMLDPIGAMTVEGPEKAGAAPEKWTFYWIEPAEVGAKTKSVSGKPPKDASWDFSLRSVVASGSRALFTFRSGSKNYVARTKGAGFETAEVGYDLSPSMEVVFGTEKGEPIAWLNGNQLVVWMSGEQPRVIATLAATGRASRGLGQPTKDGVPLLLTWTTWGLAKVLPIPVADKKDKNAKPAPHPQTVWLDGWTEIANYRRDMGHYPACGKSPKGFRVIAPRYSGFAVVDGTDESTNMASFDLRVNGKEVCVASEIQFLSSIGRPPPPPKDAKAPPAGSPVPGPVSFLRFDLLGNKAEGGDRGLPKEPPKTGPKPAPQVRKLNCKLEEKK